MVVAVFVHGATVTPAAADGGVPTVQETHTKPQQAAEMTSAKAFLLARPLGVYTCGRAVPTDDASYRLVLWAFHLTRLTCGLQRELNVNSLDEVMSEVLRATTTQLLASTLRVAADTAKGHAMVTALWSVDGNSIRIDVHVCPMPQVKAVTSNVLVADATRNEPECKHSRWVADRVPLEHRQLEVATSLGIDVHESILSVVTADGDRILLEGLITNLFVVKGGSVYTAVSDVLVGSTRELVLTACASLGIPVVLEAPRLSEIATWDAAFLTSAVRIVIPIAHVLWYPLGDVPTGDGAPRRHALDTVASEAQFLEPLRRKIYDLWQSC